METSNEHRHLECLSHDVACFQCNIAFMNIFILHTCHINLQYLIKNKARRLACDVLVELKYALK